MKKTAILSACMVLAAGFTSAALSQDKPRLGFYDSTDSIVAGLEVMGRTVSTSTNDIDEPVITVDDDLYWISLQNCENGAECTSATFYTVANAGVTIDLECANAWHAVELMGAIWVDDDPAGVPWIYESISLIGGMTVRHFEDTVQWWENHVTAFFEHTDECNTSASGKTVKRK